MTKIHTHLDVYVGDDLLWSDARIIDNGRDRTLVVKAPVPGQGRRAVLSLTDAHSRPGTERGTYVWDAVGTDGPVVLTAIRDPQCVPCGAKRR